MTCSCEHGNENSGRLKRGEFCFTKEKRAQLKELIFCFLFTVFKQLDAQNLFHNKFYFMPLHVSSTCAHRQEVQIALHSLWYHQNYRCDDTRGMN